MLCVKKHPENPIVVPGGYPWRRAAAYNPAAIVHEGKTFLFERAAASLRPHQCWIGLLESDDGVHFTHASDKPVFTPEMMGWPTGSVQDPRVVKIDNTFYMVCAVRPFAVHFGQPRGFDICTYYPSYDGTEKGNYSRSAIAVSKDLKKWKHYCFCTPEGIDDRDNMLFPEKIGGRFALLRRPQYDQYASEPSAIRISFSDDLLNWSAPEVIIRARPGVAWEAQKIGASAPPLLTQEGWLVLYHGVDKDVVYRVGAIMLDRKDPAKVLARTKVPILEPTEPYERLGPFIGNVVFPCGAVVKNGVLHIYYGCADYCIALATCAVEALVEFLLMGGGVDA